MFSKSIKIIMVSAIMLAFFGGTSMAGGKDRDRHSGKQGREYHKSDVQKNIHNRQRAHRKRPHDYRRHKVHRSHHVYRRYQHSHRYHNSKPDYGSKHRVRVERHGSVFPDFVLLGPIPIPVPPPPHKVLGLGR